MTFTTIMTGKHDIYYNHDRKHEIYYNHDRKYDIYYNHDRNHEIYYNHDPEKTGVNINAIINDKTALAALYSD